VSAALCLPDCRSACCCSKPNFVALARADKKVFPKLDVVGWYSTGVALQDADMKLQQAVRRLLLVVDSVLKL